MNYNRFYKKKKQSTYSFLINAQTFLQVCSPKRINHVILAQPKLGVAFFSSSKIKPCRWLQGVVMKYPNQLWLFKLVSECWVETQRGSGKNSYRTKVCTATHKLISRNDIFTSLYVYWYLIKPDKKLNCFFRLLAAVIAWTLLCLLVFLKVQDCGCDNIYHSFRTAFIKSKHWCWIRWPGFSMFLATILCAHSHWNK